MTTAEKQVFIQQSSQRGRVRWKVHGIQRRMQRLPFPLQQVEQSLANCEVIEYYPHLYRPLPDCLVLSFPDCLVLSFVDGKPIHAVVAIDETHQLIFIITVYQP
ncbi:MAG: DUF4258 domain-containing protein, partial [Candidatus Poribacteria bacterium]